MPCGYDVFGCTGWPGNLMPNPRRPKKKRFKGSKAAKKASRR